MTWQIGVDEAGYGPNLGPLVMTLVGVRVPDSAADLWDVLKAGVRRPGDPTDGRPLVADSKLVYSTARGLAALEHGVLALLRAGLLADPAGCLHDLVERLAVDHVDELRAEAWYAGTTALPSACDPVALDTTAGQLREAGLAGGVCRSVIVCPPRFNALVDRWDSKAAVLGVGLAHLVRDCLRAVPEGPLHFVLDKHGGRDRYGVLLQEVFYDGMVLIEAEGRERSAYRVEGLGRPVRVTVEPRADGGHFTVALASMVSKYLREALMAEFNAFWRRHVPDLKPTAGYPTDAARFLAAIRDLLPGLGLTERQVWRCR